MRIFFKNLRHFSLIAGAVFILGGQSWLNFLALHPIGELEQDVADDGSTWPPFVTDFLQVAKHSIATLYAIVRANFATSRWGAIEIQRLYVGWQKNLAQKDFGGF